MGLRHFAGDTDRRFYVQQHLVHIELECRVGAGLSDATIRSNLGLLEDVRINFVGASGLTADILFSNNQLAPFNTAGINVNMTTSISLQDATASATSADTNFLDNTTTATSSATPFNFGVGSGTLTGASTSVPSTMHAAYIGTGFVTLPMSVQFIAEATTSNGAFAVTPFPVLSLSEVSITYEFTPTAVPEPSSLAFGLMPLLGCCVRRKRRNSVKS